MVSLLQKLDRDTELIVGFSHCSASKNDNNDDNSNDDNDEDIPVDH